MNMKAKALFTHVTLITGAALLIQGCGGAATVKNETVAQKPMTVAAVQKPTKAPAVGENQQKIASINEAQLKALLVGKTQVGLDKGKTWTNTYNPDGVLTGTYSTESDSGMYTIKGNQICRKWSKWGKGTSACWTIQKRDNNYYANLQSGNSESYSFAMK